MRGVIARAGDGSPMEIRAGAVVLAARGFEANPQLRAGYRSAELGDRKSVV